MADHHEAASSSSAEHRPGKNVDVARLPEVRDSVAGQGEFDLRFFLHISTTVAQAAATAALCWPDFVEYRGGVFLEFLFDRGPIDTWFDHHGGDVKAVEAVVNHVHLWDVLDAKSPPEYAALSGLAAMMKPMWEAAARAKLDGRAVVVTATDEDIDYGPTLTLQSA
jgi:hypothetical protein